MTRPTVQIEDLHVHYGSVEALRGVSLSAAPGEIVAVLGPNGAGKTTLVRTCATLVQPTSGQVWIAGYDIAGEVAQVRRRIGLTGQYAALDTDLTVRENLELMGALIGVTASAQRASRLIHELDLGNIAARRVGALSGGSRRKADLAASMVGHPLVLFLDEPTTGLDPRARLRLWEAIEALRSAGTTIVLTTQYLEEADRLANRIIVVNHGRIIAEGTPDQLKARVGGRVVQLRLEERAHAAQLCRALTDLVDVSYNPSNGIDDSTGELQFTVADAGTAARVIAEASRLGLPMADISVTAPSLDDVFFHLTDIEEASPA
jgi:ABC-2 type transport system ATP-binding protein